LEGNATLRLELDKVTHNHPGRVRRLVVIGVILAVGVALLFGWKHMFVIYCLFGGSPTNQAINLKDLKRIVETKSPFGIGLYRRLLQDPAARSEVRVEALAGIAVCGRATELLSSDMVRVPMLGSNHGTFPDRHHGKDLSWKQWAADLDFSSPDIVISVRKDGSVYVSGYPLADSKEVTTILDRVVAVTRPVFRTSDRYMNLVVGLQVDSSADTKTAGTVLGAIMHSSSNGISKVATLVEVPTEGIRWLPFFLMFGGSLVEEQHWGLRMEPGGNIGTFEIATLPIGTGRNPTLPPEGTNDWQRVNLDTFVDMVRGGLSGVLQPSAPSRQNMWVKAFQFYASILCGEAPVDTFLLPVAVSFPRSGVHVQNINVRSASLEALGRKRSQLRLRNV
jgi:hypothetical protein